MDRSLAVPAAILAVTVGMIFGPTLHQVPEGHVAVYWLGGAMTSAVAPPGFHLKMPLITTVGIVQTSLQTDTIHNIPCGTHGGTVINFERVEVVNRLKLTHVHPTVKAYGPHYDQIWIHDKVHHEINQFCSKHTLQDVLIDKFSTIDEQMQTVLQAGCDKYDTGIEIFAVRVTKPAIPASIMRNYEKLEEEKSRLLIKVETQKVMELEAETQKLRDIIKAQQESEVSAIEQETAVRVKQADQQVQAIEDAVHLHRSKTFADATLCAPAPPRLLSVCSAWSLSRLCARSQPATWPTERGSTALLLQP
jgi:regulator of protease activity HflC (stomatin/prohibitin superfamily)